MDTPLPAARGVEAANGAALSAQPGQPTAPTSHHPVVHPPHEVRL
ncbi:hypothetical protein ACIQI7_16665 [Kitasatospora sp. NPDC092039]